MKIKGTVNNKLYFFRADITCKSETHLREFLKINGLRRMFFQRPDSSIWYVGLKGEMTIIVDAIQELTYSTIYKLSNSLTKIENQ